jgi:hypothetical protein
MRANGAPEEEDSAFRFDPASVGGDPLHESESESLSSDKNGVTGEAEEDDEEGTTVVAGEGPWRTIPAFGEGLWLLDRVTSSVTRRFLLACR